MSNPSRATASLLGSIKLYRFKVTGMLSFGTELYRFTATDTLSYGTETKKSRNNMTALRLGSRPDSPSFIPALFL
jgi:hypothetical protein